MRREYDIRKPVTKRANISMQDAHKAVSDYRRGPQRSAPAIKAIALGPILLMVALGSVGWLAAIALTLAMIQSAIVR